ncbi:hypothetical protein FDC06_09400 [Clostridium botulinum]|uniref:Uncharacterized protein n=1 Tax=Clostridium botulinum (strain Hall / ATCC 3502 / NCTC 13319 / Type A) TaxID=441771 RepID=A5I0R8_CLOBH|nr:hypothetical protein DB732_05850 [Clostridium botulinum]CAL82629.1 hypothetical protein CBO1075 [Clostridium botulinum A str. ATCC 3502]AWB29793.1 hypothetical protein DBN47_05830 [Clostridium botulinum]EGT5614869.1 hypothetical protein [Clostridium botulinum]EGT5622022.1 hypothetical protein [Clostridium botulinum]
MIVHHAHQAVLVAIKKKKQIKTKFKITKNNIFKIRESNFIKHKFNSRILKMLTQNIFNFNIAKIKKHLMNFLAK